MSGLSVKHPNCAYTKLRASPDKKVNMGGSLLPRRSVLVHLNQRLRLRPPFRETKMLRTV